jgi:hypothetical protein
MTWIEPLSLETWLMQVFAGNPDIFLAIALLAIFGLAGYFRMTIMAMFFLMATFLLMFTGFISSPVIILVAVIGGLLLGFQLSKMFS